LAPGDLTRFLEVDGHDHIAFVAVRVDTTGREWEPLGFVRCQRLKPGGRVAELSMVTVDQVQGLGVGSALLSRLIPCARPTGIDRFWFEVLMENNGMCRLAKKFGAKAKGTDDGTLEYDCLLADALPATPPAMVTPPPIRPTRPKPPHDWPWYLNPITWGRPWIETWRADLDCYLTRLEAANENASR